MPISEQEQKDLDFMKAANEADKRGAYDLMREFLRMDDAALKNCGHKSKEAALLYTMTETEKRVQRRTAAHIKKYPD